MEAEIGLPFRGEKLAELKTFLAAQGLSYDESIEKSVVLREDGEIVASASLGGETVKCFAAKAEQRGLGLSGKLITEIRKLAAAEGKKRLFLVTKPENTAIFSELLFSEIASAEKAVFMESPSGGIERFIKIVLSESGASTVGNGAVVLNGNPFTRGHRYLIEKAAESCRHVFVFVLSEEKSLFSSAERLDMARLGTEDLQNVSVHPTEGYLVSSATFPDYFLKDKADLPKAFCGIDIAVFGEKIAPALGIEKRFVGTEPYSEITRFYNDEMKLRLPRFGIELIEEKRLEAGGKPISATKTRRLIEEKNSSGLSEMLPEKVLVYLAGNGYI